MASGLEASIKTSSPKQNLLLPGDTAAFDFSNAPNAAEGVVVTFLETITFLNSFQPGIKFPPNAPPTVTDRFVAAFHGLIKNGQFVLEKIQGTPKQPSLGVIRVAVSLAPGSPGLFIETPSPEQVESHTMRLRVQGTVSGTNKVFEQRSVVHVDAPAAMVVPAGPASHDISLDIVLGWSEQWRAKKNTLRHVHTIPVANTRAIKKRPGQRLVRKDYDGFVTALGKAAADAPGGIVALAIGHGDPGDSGQFIAWANLVPENEGVPDAEKVPPIPFNYALDIDEQNLKDGSGTAIGPAKPLPPTHNTSVKLDALDRVADQFEALRQKGKPIRKLLLHTCRAGASTEFMQRLADRLRVPVFAHKLKIEYDGSRAHRQQTKIKIAGHYSSDAIVRPRDETEWPSSAVGLTALPGKPPPRFGIVP